MASFLGYIEKEGRLPDCLTFSLAALMAFYTGSEMKDSALTGHRNGCEYKIMDDAEVLNFFAVNSSKNLQEFVKLFLKRTDFFGEDMSEIQGLEEKLTGYLEDIRAKGMREALHEVIG